MAYNGESETSSVKFKVVMQLKQNDLFGFSALILDLDISREYLEAFDKRLREMARENSVDESEIIT